MNEYNQIVDELRTLSDPQKQIDLPRFFKTGPGEYGEFENILKIAAYYINKALIPQRSQRAITSELAKLEYTMVC